MNSMKFKIAINCAKIETVSGYGMDAVLTYTVAARGDCIREINVSITLVYNL